MTLPPSLPSSPAAAITSPEGLLRCEPYGATIQASACVQRQDLAAGSHCPDRVRLCRGCGTGAEVLVALGVGRPRGKTGPPTIGAAWKRLGSVEAERAMRERSKRGRVRKVVREPTGAGRCGAGDE